MTSVQPKTTEHVYPIQTLQDGRNECGNANAAEKRLDVLNRHKRRILRSSNYTTTQEIPAVCLGYKTTRVSVPTVWIELSTSSIYQTSTPSSGTSSLGGDSSSNLLGRYHNSESITGRPNTESQHNTLVITGPRFWDKLGEISHATDTADRISRGIGILKIHKECSEILTAEKISVRRLSRLIGILNTFVLTELSAPLHYRRLQMQKSRGLLII